MQYSIIFLIFSAFLCRMALVLSGPLALILLWPAANFAVLSAAYAFRRPSLILGKDHRGKIVVPLLVLNFPWLALSWISLRTLAELSSEPAIHRIGETHFHIGRCPFPGEDLSRFALIIDLTAEFPDWYARSGKYLCAPNLDGIPLYDIPMPTIEAAGDPILIHCAQGHGRSATFAAILLMSLGHFETASAALDCIERSRPGAKPNSQQRKQVEAYQPGAIEES